MTNEMKAHDICVQIARQNGRPFGGDAFIAIMQMAKWKDEQAEHLINRIIDDLKVAFKKRKTIEPSRICIDDIHAILKGEKNLSDANLFNL